MPLKFEALNVHQFFFSDVQQLFFLSDSHHRRESRNLGQMSLLTSQQIGIDGRNLLPQLGADLARLVEFADDARMFSTSSIELRR